jgi:TrmH family RNA methyltransferase
LLAAAEFERLCVVLVRTRNPLNIGAAARAMSNFGFSQLRVVNPYEAAFREAHSAVGASPVLAAAREYASVAEAVADCTLVVGTTAVRSRELHHPLKRLESGALAICKELRRTPHIRREAGRKQPSAAPRVAIVFGSEKTGLSNDAMSHCHWLMRIPTSEQNISMNLGQAVAVCLYELIRGGKSPRPPQGKMQRGIKLRERAAAGELERMTALLLDALHASGYLPAPVAEPAHDLLGRKAKHVSQRAALVEEKLRRLVRRLDLSADDATIWMGILRQIAWKLQSL